MTHLCMGYGGYSYYMRYIYIPYMDATGYTLYHPHEEKTLTFHFQLNPGSLIFGSLCHGL